MTSNHTEAHPLTPVPLGYDAEAGTYHTRHDSLQSDTISQAIVATIATIEARDPCDLSFTLYDYVDPDALDTVFAPCSDGTPRSNGRIELAIGPYDICAHADGRLAITPQVAKDG